jgi:hypothetical protein
LAERSRVTQSAKLGITSVVLLLIAVVPPFLNWRYPITFVSVGLSGLFGLLAAQQGSRWWLTVPAITIGGVSLAILPSIRSDDE